MRQTKLERRVEFDKAWDKRHKDRDKDYGFHGVNLRMAVVGPKGAVSFVVFTNWQLPEVKGKQLDPYPVEIAYHHLDPAEDATFRDDCPYHEGGCNLEVRGSYTGAYELWDTLLREGSDGVWLKLERRYREEFER